MEDTLQVTDKLHVLLFICSTNETQRTKNCLL